METKTTKSDGRQRICIVATNEHEINIFKAIRNNAKKANLSLNKTIINGLAQILDITPVTIEVKI